MTGHRRRIKQTEPLSVRLAKQAKAIRDRAEELPPGAERDALMKKAREAEAGANIEGWITSSGLQPPQ
jgi:hypothetical protein